MKRIIAILFLSTYLLSSTEMHEFLRLPFFIENFKMHQKQDHYTLWQFVKHHYFGDDKIQYADSADDMQLPFKNHWDLSSFRTVFIILPTTIIRSFTVTISSKEYINYTHTFVPSAQVSTIWQPPKMI